MQEIITTYHGQIALLAIIYIFVLAVVFLDLWAGVRKARKRGEYRSSYGLRKTVEKICKYYNMELVVTAIDVIQMLAICNLHQQGSTSAIPVVPMFSIFGALFIGFIELKSIWEKAEDKDRAKVTEAAKALAKIAAKENQTELLKSIFELIAIANEKEGREGYIEKGRYECRPEEEEKPIE